MAINYFIFILYENKLLIVRIGDTIDLYLFLDALKLTPSQFYEKFKSREGQRAKQSI